MKELLLTTITKPAEIIVNKFFCLCLFLSSCFHAVKGNRLEPTRGTSILEEVSNVEISGPTQQLLCSKYHDFLAIFALVF